MRAWLPVGCAVVAVIIGACRFDVDPDEGRFSCGRDQDCGRGFVCIPQANHERGLCYPVGACATVDSECNEKDDDCNGVVDDVTWKDQPCDSPEPGACRPGGLACEDGRILCVSTVEPTAETCDLIDNDCDGEIDEDFDFNTDVENCGGCTRACESGNTCRLGLCVETACDNQLDDDFDGFADCDDADCLGQTCRENDPDSRCALVSPAVLDGGVETDGGFDGDAGFDADAGWDPDAGVETDGGFDGDAGMEPDAGVEPEPVPACVPPESNCANGLDDDGDGLVDCADPGCVTCGEGRVCINGQCMGTGWNP